VAIFIEYEYNGMMNNDVETEMNVGVLGMIWHEVTLHSTEEAMEMISNFFHEHGAGGVSIEETGSLDRARDTSYGQLYDTPFNDLPEGEAIIKAYYPEMDNINLIVDQLNQFIAEIRDYPTDVGKASLSVKIVDDEDWANAWKQYFKPVRITDRITIKPTWEEYEATPEELIIEIDPGMAFGTGTHATTSLCLQSLEKYIQSGMDVIDIGTGSGILSIGAVKLGAKHVLALDLDPVAIVSASENVALNKQEDHITVIQSDLLQVLQRNDDAIHHGLGVTIPVDLAVANILAEVILMFIDDVYQALKPGGIYITSGIIGKKRAEVERALEQAGFQLLQTIQDQDQDWVAITAKK
jgi:ribosomal protein L11 methyltransferase